MKTTEPGKTYQLGENPDQIEKELREGGGIRLDVAGKEILENQDKINKAREVLAKKKALEEQRRRDAAQKRLLDSQERAREKEVNDALKAERQRIAEELRLSFLETIRYVHFNVLAEHYLNILRERARAQKTTKKQENSRSSAASKLVLDAVIIEDGKEQDHLQLPEITGQNPILSKLPQRDKGSGKKQF